jgi:hypothetical protein
MTRSDHPAVDDIDTSQYYVIRKGEYDDMKAEIERLRTALNVAADEVSRAELFWNMTPNELADRYIHLAQTIIELDGPTRIGGPQ